MTIIFQFTLTDIRRFQNRFSLLKVPQWPLPKPYKEFLRGHGQIIPTQDQTIAVRLGMISISENLICKINKGIKVPKKIYLENIEIRNKINHCFCDGEVLAKYEFVFETAERDLKYTYSHVKKIIKKILDTNVLVKDKNFKYANYKFKSLFKALIQLQIISTTEKKYFNDDHEKYILRCSPQIFITIGKTESFSFKSKRPLYIPLKESLQSSIYGWWENYYNNPYKFWLLENFSAFKNRNLNTLKAGILRIHSEKECINNIIQSIIVGLLITVPESDESEFLQRFLNEKIKNLGLSYKKINSLDANINQVENFIKEVYEKFNPGEITLLNERMRQLKLRPQIEKKIIQHIVNNSSRIEKQYIMDNSITFGDNANFQGDISQGNVYSNSGLNYKEVYTKIDELLEQVKQEKNSYEKEVAIENLENAKKAAVREDKLNLLNSLKKAGQWTIDFASKIGVNFITEVLKHQIH